MPLKIIVPAAGESKRFRQKGILTPKPLIRFSWGKLRKKTMLEHAVHGLDNETINVGISERNEDLFKKASLNPRFQYHIIDYSMGQADTVRQVVNQIPETLDSQNYSLLIVNSDSMFLYPLSIFINQVRDYDGGAMVFNGEYNPAYSYVDKYPLFDKCAEKEPLSPWAMAGAFYFRSRNEFLEAYKQYVATSPKEEYISEVYNFLPGKKLAVFVPREQWIVWGTAEELLSDDSVNELEF